MALVRFTDAALQDLRALQRKDPQIVRQVLKMCLLLERDPYAGQPLLGSLVGYRKLVVGDRHWRIVWRVIEGDTTEVDIAEIWAAGARADSEVYEEVKRRTEEMGDHALGSALDQIVEMLAPASVLDPTPEPVDDPIPQWLRERLVQTAGVSPSRLENITGEEAMELWERYMRGGSL